MAQASGLAHSLRPGSPGASCYHGFHGLDFTVSRFGLHGFTGNFTGISRIFHGFHGFTGGFGISRKTSPPCVWGMGLGEQARAEDLAPSCHGGFTVHMGSERTSMELLTARFPEAHCCPPSNGHVPAFSRARREHVLHPCNRARVQRTSWQCTRVQHVHACSRIRAAQRTTSLLCTSDTPSCSALEWGWGWGGAGNSAQFHILHMMRTHFPHPRIEAAHTGHPCTRATHCASATRASMRAFRAVPCTPRFAHEGRHACNARSCCAMHAHGPSAKHGAHAAAQTPRFAWRTHGSTLASAQPSAYGPATSAASDGAGTKPERLLSRAAFLETVPWCCM